MCVLTDLLLYFRVTTRTCTLTFTLPTVGPTTREEEDAWTELDEVVGELSSCIGWAISVGECPTLQDEVMAIKCPTLQDEVMAIKDELRHSVEGRKLKNWAILLFFVKKVGSIYIDR